MSNDRVQRGFKSRHSRSAGEAPALGKVARMPGVGQPKGERRMRRRTDRRNTGRTARWNAKLTVGWSIALGVLALGSVVAAVILWLLPMIERNHAAGQGVAEVKVRIESKFPSPSEDAAISLVQGVLESGVEGQELEGRVRMGGMTWEQVGGFLAGRIKQDGEVTRYEWVGAMDDNDMQIESVLVHSEKDGVTKIRPAFLTPDASGVWQMDLPSYARPGEPSWTTLLEDEEWSGVVRVYLGEDHYYNGPFMDESEWKSYGASSPDGDTLLVVYCRVGSIQEAAMSEIFKRSGMKDRQLGYATLELRRVEGAEKKQFEITKVLAEGWVVGEVPFDERLKMEQVGK